jgi:hypothetical protein
MKAGDYCVETWQYDSGGGYSGVAECIGVDS